MYKTSYTFELLTPEAAVDTRRVVSNCNAITFRAMHQGAAWGIPTNDLNGLSTISTLAPTVEGIKLMPGILQDVVISENYTIQPGQHYQVQSVPGELHFEAGHPDALDTTVYTVELRADIAFPGLSVMVIRRFITRT